MTAFDLETSYANDWQLGDFIEELTWEYGEHTLDGIKGRRADLTGPQFLPVAASIGLTTTAAAFVVWQPTVNDDGAIEPAVLFDPQPKQAFIDADKTRWMIVWSEKSRFGNWNVIVDLEPQNA